MEKETNILVVEDNEKAAACLESTLKSAGYHVWLTKDPQEGLEFLRANLFPVAITELHLPKMNGKQFTQKAHQISEGVNILVLTPYSFVASAIEAMEEGAYGYITKPLNTSEIRIVVERAVERYYLLSSSGDKEYFVELAIRDGLTGLFNRRYFNEIVNVEINRLQRSPASLSLLMLDIDNFKNYNDTQGHQAGDELLKTAAKIFKNSVRAVDIVSRYGGEEFVVILPQADKAAAQIIAERLRVQVNLYLSLTVSIGISTIPDDASNLEQLIEKADSALYEAKKTGKNKWVSA